MLVRAQEKEMVPNDDSSRVEHHPGDRQDDAESEVASCSAYHSLLKNSNDSMLGADSEETDHV